MRYARIEKILKRLAVGSERIVVSKFRIAAVEIVFDKSRPRRSSVCPAVYAAGKILRPVLFGTVYGRLLPVVNGTVRYGSGICRRKFKGVSVAVTDS